MSCQNAGCEFMVWVEVDYVASKMNDNGVSLVHVAFSLITGF